MVLGSPDADCEVLRRDLAADVGRECFSELRRNGSHTTLPHASTPLGKYCVHYFLKVRGQNKKIIGYFHSARMH